MLNLKKLVLVPLLLGSGCAAEVAVRPPVVAVGVGAAAVEPSLVSIGPGVEVVADYDTPVFFADSFYWSFDNGFWYRSAFIGGPRVVIERPPIAVISIRNPAMYVHYHASPHVAHRSLPARDVAAIREQRRANAEMHQANREQANANREMQQANREEAEAHHEQAKANHEQEHGNHESHAKQARTHRR